MSARQRFEQNQKMQVEREKKLSQRAYLNRTNPNAVEEAQNSFWMTHINASDIYHSFIKGTNPWARSSAFTQPLARTRGALGYYQNAHNNTMIYGFPGTFDVQKKILLDKERDKVENGRKLLDKISDCGIRQFIVDKILKGCAKKGWIGLRNLKTYLRSISPHDCDIIDKNSFKHYLDQQGIRLDFSEVTEICEIFDKNKNDHINFIEFLNAIRYVTESRMQQIDEFFNQVKDREKNSVLFSKLNRIADTRFHPEVMRYQKSASQIRMEYEKYWDRLKIDDTISEEHFKQFFYDISSVVENDRDFTQILKALGYK
jgi:Ca2+-binding EF-hand superfamily protein